MLATLQPICGVQIGVEFTEAEIDGKIISYCLIDLLILRIQVAWFKE
jgi:hypothetical protein